MTLEEKEYELGFDAGRSWATEHLESVDLDRLRRRQALRPRMHSLPPDLTEQERSDAILVGKFMAGFVDGAINGKQGATLEKATVCGSIPPNGPTPPEGGTR